MSKTRSIVAFALFVPLGFVGAWLMGFFETTDPTGDVSAWDLIKAFLGFLMFIAALIGIILIIRQNIGAISETDAKEWQAVRKRGKRRYILIAVLKGIFLGLVFLVPLIAYQSEAKAFETGLNVYLIYSALLFASVLSYFTAAVRTWNANEKELEAAARSKPLAKDVLD